MEKLEKKQGSIIAILAMIFLFAMIAFVTNLCSPMAVILKNNFSVSESLAQVGNYGNFGAYLLMGILQDCLFRSLVIRLLHWLLWLWVSLAYLYNGLADLSDS